MPTTPNASSATIPCSNYGLQCISIGFMVSQTDGTAVVWQGLMAQKVISDMPPGTGDVQLTLGQLVQVDGAVIVSTPQDVTLINAEEGFAMVHKTNVPIIGLLLNRTHFTCNLLNTSPSFNQTADALNLKILGELPIAPSVSADGDSGSPTTIRRGPTGNVQGIGEVQSVMDGVAKQVLEGVVAKAM